MPTLPDCNPTPEHVWELWAKEDRPHVAYSTDCQFWGDCHQEAKIICVNCRRKICPVHMMEVNQDLADKLAELSKPLMAELPKEDVLLCKPNQQHTWKPHINQVIETPAGCYANEMHCRMWDWCHFPAAVICEHCQTLLCTKHIQNFESVAAAALKEPPKSSTEIYTMPPDTMALAVVGWRPPCTHEWTLSGRGRLTKCEADCKNMADYKCTKCATFRCWSCNHPVADLHLPPPGMGWGTLPIATTRTTCRVSLRPHAWVSGGVKTGCFAEGCGKKSGHTCKNCNYSLCYACKGNKSWVSPECAIVGHSWVLKPEGNEEMSCYKNDCVNAAGLACKFCLLPVCDKCRVWLGQMLAYSELVGKPKPPQEQWVGEKAFNVGNWVRNGNPRPEQWATVVRKPEEKVGVTTSPVSGRLCFLPSLPGPHVCVPLTGPVRPCEVPRCTHMEIQNTAKWICRGCELAVCEAWHQNTFNLNFCVKRCEKGSRDHVWEVRDYKTLPGSMPTRCNIRGCPTTTNESPSMFFCPHCECTLCAECGMQARRCGLVTQGTIEPVAKPESVPAPGGPWVRSKHFYQRLDPALGDIPCNSPLCTQAGVHNFAKHACKKCNLAVCDAWHRNQPLHLDTCLVRCDGGDHSHSWVLREWQFVNRLDDVFCQNVQCLASRQEYPNVYVCLDCSSILCLGCYAKWESRCFTAYADAPNSEAPAADAMDESPAGGAPDSMPQSNYEREKAQYVHNLRSGLPTYVASPLEAYHAGEMDRNIQRNRAEIARQKEEARLAEDRSRQKNVAKLVQQQAIFIVAELQAARLAERQARSNPAPSPAPSPDEMPSLIRADPMEQDSVPPAESVAPSPDPGPTPRRLDTYYKEDGTEDYSSNIFDSVELTEFPDDDVCVVCMDAPRKIVLLPCGHLQLCTLCAGKVKTCPSCRALITKRVVTYK